MDRDFPAAHLQRGDILLTCAYRGEGFSAVWFKGKYYRNFDITFTRFSDGFGCGGDHCRGTYLDLGRKEWWAKLKLKSGGTRWVNMRDAYFKGVNAFEDR